MKNAELHAKLNAVDAKLNALGDVAALVQQSSNLPDLVQKTQNALKSVEELITQLRTQKEAADQLSAEANTLKTDLQAKTEKATELVEQVEGLQTKTEELKQETLRQLGRAADEKLSSSFELVKEELKIERDKWFKYLSRGVIALVIAVVLIAIWQIKESNTLYHFGFLIKIALTSPIVFFVGFVGREYSRTRNLIEEYTFKSAIARNFGAYKEILDEAFDGQEAPVYQRHLEFIIEAIKSLYSSPMRNIKKNIQKEKELTPDVLGQVRDIVKKNQPE